MTTNEAAVQKELDQAHDAEQRRQESIDRCDTDGFVSQWALSLNAQLHRTQAQIEANGGVWEFETLADAETGELVNCKEITGQYGPCFAILDSEGKFTGEFVPTYFTSRSKHWAKYRIATVEKLAKAITWSPPGARGLGGATDVRIRIVPKWQPEAI